MDYRNMYSAQNIPPPSAEHSFVPRLPYADETHQQLNIIDGSQYQSQLPTNWTATPGNTDQNNFQYKCAPNNEISGQAMLANRPFTKRSYLYPLSEINIIEGGNEYKSEVKPDVKFEIKPELKPEIKFELQPMCKSEIKYEVVKSELKSELKNETKDDIKCMTNITTENGGGKRIKLMQYDDKSSVSLPESKNIDLTLDDSTVEESKHRVVKSSEDFSIIAKLLQEKITISKYTNKLLEDLLLQNSTPKNTKPKNTKPKNTKPKNSTSSENGKQNEQQTIRENFRSTFPYLPAKNVEEMLDMDLKISQDESRQLMVKRLGQIGGKNICETTAIIFRTIMTDECATFYNYDVRINKQFLFKDLKIHDVFIDVIKSAHDDVTEQIIRKKIKNFLRLASTRIGNKSGGQYNKRGGGAQTSFAEGSSLSCDPPPFQSEQHEPLPSFQPEPQPFFQ